MSQISNFVKIRPAGAELFHVDGWTDLTKLIVAFRNLVNAPKNSVSQTHVITSWTTTGFASHSCTQQFKHEHMSSVSARQPFE